MKKTKEQLSERAAKLKTQVAARKSAAADPVKDASLRGKKKQLKRVQRRIRLETNPAVKSRKKKGQ